MADLAAEQVRIALRRSRQCNPGPCIPLDRDTWQVEINGGQFVGKWVPMGRRSGFEAGLGAAEHVDAFGVGAGTPVRAADGALTVAEGDGGGGPAPPGAGAPPARGRPARPAVVG